MLQELTVENFVLIDSLTIQFDSRLNLLSGETGAGKSILIDAVGFLLGKKPDKSMIRSGSDRAVVQGIFKISESKASLLHADYGVISEEGLLVIQRELFSSGRSTARVNGFVVTTGTLEAVSETLIDFHGQHAHQSLLHPKNHLKTLDAYAGEVLTSVREEVRQCVEQLHALEKTAKSHGTDKEAIIKRMDAITFEIQEIESAHLVIGEDSDLEEQHELLSNMEQIIQNLNIIQNIMSDDEMEGVNVLKGLSETVRRLSQIGGYNSELKQHEKSFTDIYHQCADASKELSRFCDRLYFDGERYVEITQRLDLINGLKRKYGSGIGTILDYLDALQKEKEAFEGSLDALENYRIRRHTLVEHYTLSANRLTELRRQSALAFQQAIVKELRVLNLPHAQLAFSFDSRKDPFDTGIHQDGADIVELMISMNPGEPLKPLKSVASGGELSRLMLALKIVQARGDDVDTLVFDEIDSGISGKTATAVGEKLVQVSGFHQVLCISHLAQICALGDCHYLIEKQVTGETTVTKVKPLKSVERRDEIARILGGAHFSDATQKASEELLKNGDLLRKQRDERMAATSEQMDSSLRARG